MSVLGNSSWPPVLMLNTSLPVPLAMMESPAESSPEMLTVEVLPVVTETLKLDPLYMIMLPSMFTTALPIPVVAVAPLVP